MYIKEQPHDFKYWNNYFDSNLIGSRKLSLQLWEIITSLAIFFLFPVFFSMLWVGISTGFRDGYIVNGHNAMQMIHLFGSLIMGGVMIVYLQKKYGNFIQKTGLAPFLFFSVMPFINAIILVIPNINSLLAQSLATIICIAICISLIWKTEKQTILKVFRKFHVTIIMVAITVAIVMVSNIFGNVITNFIKRYVTLPTQSANESALMDESHGAMGAFSLVLLTVFCAPIIEELALRKGIFDILKNDWVAVFLSGLIFGAMHIHGYQMSGDGVNRQAVSLLSDWANIFSYASFGWGAAIVYKFVKNTAPTIGAHATTNLISVVSSLT